MTRKTSFTIVNRLYFTENTFITFRQCLYASAERNKLPYPLFATAFRVNKLHDFANGLKMLLRVICKSLLSLTSNDC